jgi:hypothetical protein
MLGDFHKRLENWQDFQAEKTASFQIKWKPNCEPNRWCIA